MRTGAFRASWHRKVYTEELEGENFNVRGVTESSLRVGKYLLGELLDEGTEHMAPRPYRQRAAKAAMPKVLRIYSAPYGRSYGP